MHSGPLTLSYSLTLKDLSPGPWLVSRASWTAISHRFSSKSTRELRDDRAERQAAALLMSSTSSAMRIKLSCLVWFSAPHFAVLTFSRQDILLSSFLLLVLALSAEKEVGSRCSRASSNTAKNGA